MLCGCPMAQQLQPAASSLPTPSTPQPPAARHKLISKPPVQACSRLQSRIRQEFCHVCWLLASVAALYGAGSSSKIRQSINCTLWGIPYHLALNLCRTNEVHCQSSCLADLTYTSISKGARALAPVDLEQYMLDAMSKQLLLAQHRLRKCATDWMSCPK